MLAPLPGAQPQARLGYLKRQLNGQSRLRAGLDTGKTVPAICGLTQAGLSSFAVKQISGAHFLAAAFAPAAAATIRAQAAGTRQLGIQGVPHFKIGGRALHGAQDPEALVAALTA